MPNPRGFLEVRRATSPERDPAERVRDYGEIYGTLPPAELQRQAGRCMDCGVPFCNNACPLGNLIPDWNDLVRGGDWEQAIEQLHATNNFPEFTGLICPAPCESACVLDIDDDPVMIKQVEWSIIEHAFAEGWVKARREPERTGKSVVVVGSGPAGLAVADELNQVGHTVTVLERDEGPGGLLRFGVPDAKLEKWMIDRRVALLEEEGITFEYGVDVGVDRDAAQLAAENDAVVLAIGSRVERDLEVPGRELEGVHFAMEYLYGRNRHVARTQGRPAPPVDPETEITAAGKRVVVIGGGDTGMDCVSNALREEAAEVLLLDVYPDVPEGGRYADNPWPLPHRRLATTYALEEGAATQTGERRFAQQVVALEGNGNVERVHGRGVTGTSSRNLEPVEGSEFIVEADLVLIAVGFTHPEHGPLLEQLSPGLDDRGNLAAKLFETSKAGVFAAGDARLGQSLVVTAIAEGRRCARVIDRKLRAPA